MGCASSKLDDLPAVALCRDRCTFLDDAIRQRFAFAQSHFAYTHSLLRVGNSLHHFMEQHHGSYAGVPPLSPKLNLPPHRKGHPDDDHGEPTSPIKVRAPDRHSHSNSGSHLHFHSGDDSDDDSVSHLHHSDHSSPLHTHIDTAAGGPMEYMSTADYMGMGADHDSFPGGGFLRMNYMKNKATPPSVVYEQKPRAPETVYFGDSSSSSYYYPNNSNPPNNPTPNPYFGYPNYGYDGGGGGAVAGYYGAQPPYGAPPAAAAASSSKPPPPPPSPPRASAWDFLNPFESYDKFNPRYTPSRNSKELREEEGIPDLEDEDYQREVVKEVDVDQKYVGSKSVMVDDDDDDDVGGASSSGGRPEASLYQTRPSVSTGNDRVEYDVHVVDKKIVDSNERSEERSSNSGGGGRGGAGPRDAAEVAVEIKILFEKASECGIEIAKLLEVGRHPHHRKHGWLLIFIFNNVCKITSSV